VSSNASSVSFKFKEGYDALPSAIHVDFYPDVFFTVAELHIDVLRCFSCTHRPNEHFVPSRFKKSYFLKHDWEAVIHGVSVFEVEFTYVYRETEYSMSDSHYGSYININSETSSQLHATPRFQYLDDYPHQGATFVIHLKESPYWLSENEKPIIGGPQAFVFLMLALLAVNHAIALFTALIRQLYLWTKPCRRKLKARTHAELLRRDEVEKEEEESRRLLIRVLKSNGSPPNNNTNDISNGNENDDGQRRMTNGSHLPPLPSAPQPSSARRLLGAPRPPSMDEMRDVARDEGAQSDLDIIATQRRNILHDSD